MCAAPSLRRSPGVLLAIALAAALAIVVAAQSGESAGELRQRAEKALSPIDGELALDGLRAPVDVIRDTWGVPHIYASTVEDLFFAQGFVAAQDRLWQMDLWRRTADGHLAEVLGPGAVARDTFARLLRYRGDADAEWKSYAPDARRIAEAFVRGVNAQVTWALAAPERLPLEFQLTGTRPAPWTPEVVIGRMAGYVMTRNARTEVQRALLAQRVGVQRVAEFMPPEPPVAVVSPEGLDLADLTPDVLGLADAADAPVRYELTKPAAWFARPAERLAALSTEYSTVGSNNWVVDARKSLTGAPLLANDPHRPIQLPSLRYTVHLNGPGWNVIGAGEPALPGIAAGHNDRVAFGFTIVGIDQQDLYVERTDPANPKRYQYKGQWEDMRVERESIAVAGGGAREVELLFTRHGPVVHADAARHRAYALRWVGQEPGTAGYLASLSLDTVKSWPEFLSALERWKVPSENLIYADVDGNIGWVAAGMAPVRRNWNGLLPVPGHEGRYEWSGFLKVGDLPQASNPPRGFIATANHNILPAGYPRMLGYEWSSPVRFDRIVEVLQENRRFSVGDLEALQHDELSIVARAVAEALQIAIVSAPVAGADRAAAAKFLAGWNGTMAKDSPQAALYQLWLPHLTKAFTDALTPPQDRANAPERISYDRLRDILKRPTARDFAILTGPSLDAAIAEARQKMGPTPDTWSWGAIHRAKFEHPLATTDARREVMNLAGVPRGGDGTTVNNTGNGPVQVHGASFREVVDVADWDRSSTINVPGSSGQPGSRFYGNLLPLWASGQYHPLLFTRAAVDRHAAARLRLLPAGLSSAPAGHAPSPPGPPPTLPPFVGRLVNYDRSGSRVAVCAAPSGGGEVTVGGRTFEARKVWVLDGETLRELGSTPTSCDPAWSPDGSRLALVTESGLWTYSPILEEPRQLVEAKGAPPGQGAPEATTISKPRWSPDGVRLAYLVMGGGTTWVEAIDAGNGRRIFKSDADTYTFEWTTDPRALKIGNRTIRLQ